MARPLKETTPAHRWQASMGAITAALVAGASVKGESVWTDAGIQTLTHAEDLLRGQPIPIDLSMPHASAVAVGLASASVPLLVDGAVCEFLDVVRGWLLEARLIDVADPRLVAAIEGARAGARFEEALCADGDPAQRILNATLVGLVGGIGAVPARHASNLTEPGGRRGRRYLARLTDRLLGIERVPTYDPRNRRGPREVLPGLWLSNLFGVAGFVAAHPDGLVVSLCDPEGRLDKHDQQITFHIDDTPKLDANPSLAIVLDEVLGEVAQARSEGRPVLVHCRHGASRTGLVLRLILIDELGLDPEAALTEAQCLWPHTSEWNKAWWRATVERSAE